MWLEILQQAQVCPSEVFNFGSKLARACHGIGDMTFWEFMGSDCVRFVGAVMIAPFVEAVQDAMASWGSSSDSSEGSTSGTGNTGGAQDSRPAEEVTLAELLGEEQLTLADVLGE